MVQSFRPNTEPSIAKPRPATQFRQQLWWLSHYKEIDELNSSRNCSYYLTRQNVDVSNADSLDDVQSSCSAAGQASRRVQIHVIRGLHKAVSLATHSGLLQDIDVFARLDLYSTSYRSAEWLIDGARTRSWSRFIRAMLAL